MPAPAQALRLEALVCHVEGSGPPLVLLHSINAAAGVHEVRPLIEHFRASHTVYAPDLPGFGASPRPDIAYTPRLYTEAVKQVVRAAQAGAATPAAPVPAMALSLSCEFLARAAVEEPALFSRLVLVSPTGLMGTRPRRGPPGASRAVPGLHAVLAAPWWGERLFRGLTRPGVVRYFLRRTFGSEQIDESLWAGSVAAARAPGAHHAPLHFLSAGLFSADVLALYEGLTMPVWASHGTRGDFTDYRGRRFLEGRAHWQWTVYDGGALPYFEHREAFAAAMQRFLAEPRPR
jgi:pimeloyl-ACP methyl ester carboxylesterase